MVRLARLCQRGRSCWIGPARFSESMLEALSIVALRQPVVAAEIEKICGVDRHDALLRLEGMGLIEQRAGQDRAWTFGPIAGLQYVHGSTDSFTENDAAALIPDRQFSQIEQ